jgi:peptidoglycan hydrolase-like protein with peptidoglycan-binding domain
MWNRYGMTIAALGLGLAASLVSYEVAQAARSRNYTPREFRSVLRGFGYNLTVNDTPLTDKETIAAIRQFQQGYKIQADGIAGPQTQDLAAALVSILQANLNLVLKPSPALPKSQFYGALTEAAIRRYQKQAGLPDTGIATLAIRQRIDNEATRILKNQAPAPSAAPTTTPQPSPSPSPSPIPQTSPSPSPSPIPQTSPSPSPSPIPQTSPSPFPSPIPQTSPSPSPSPAPQTSPNRTPAPSR